MVTAWHDWRGESGPPAGRGTGLLPGAASLLQGPLRPRSRLINLAHQHVPPFRRGVPVA